MNITRLKKSLIKIKICSFFHQNPSVVDTARNIALWIAHDLKEVEGALEGLVKDKVLLAHRTSSTTGYAYTQDASITSEIAGHSQLSTSGNKGLANFLTSFNK